MVKLSPKTLLYNRPRPGLDYLLVQFLFLGLLVAIPQIQCRNGCFIWTPWRIVLFGLIYLGLLWYIADAFRLKYMVTGNFLVIHTFWLNKAIRLTHIREVSFIPGFPLKKMISWTGRNVLNRYHNLVLVTTKDRRKYYLSPKDPEIFIRTLKKVLPEENGNHRGE